MNCPEGWRQPREDWKPVPENRTQNVSFNPY